MQRLKKAIKKIAAIGVGVAMLGATMTSALALDLAEYPAPFVDANGVFDDTTALVVGSKAIGEGAASDTLGAISIATSLQYLAKTPVKTTGGTLSVSGGVTEDIPLDFGIANATTVALDWSLDDSDVSSFLDSSINYQSKDYDVHDELTFDIASPSLETSLTSPDDDYEANVFMEIVEDSIKYYFLFDEALNVSKASTDEPLTIKFLGKTLKITNVPKKAGGTLYTDTFTAYVGSEYFMKAGDSVTVDGKKVTLENVGSGGAIQVNVDGTLEVIPAAATETVNGIEIANRETFYEDTMSERAAQLVIGSDAVATYTDGDAYAGEDEDAPDWVWNIGRLGQDSATTLGSNEDDPSSGGAYIGIENDFVKVSDTDNPVGIGECYELPNSYASVCLDSLTVADDDYLTLTIERKANVNLDKSGYAGTSTKATTLHIYTPKAETIEIPAGATTVGNSTVNDAPIQTNEIWFFRESTNNYTMMYYQSDNYNPRRTYLGYLLPVDNATGPRFARIRWGDTKDTNVQLRYFQDEDRLDTIRVDINGDSTSELSDGGDDIVALFNLDNGAKGGNYTALGATLAESESMELIWSEDVDNTSIGTKDEDHRTRYGIIIRDPKSNGASDQVVLEIPKDQVQGNIVVKGQATTVAGGTVAYVPTRIDVNPMIDSEIASPEDHQLILVGGPVVNMLTKTFLGAGWDYASGEALIKLMANGEKVALILAGTDAIDTRMACKVLANYDQYTLAGVEAVVAGSISAPTIKV